MYILYNIVCLCYFTMSKCPSSKLPSLRKWIEEYNKSGKVFKILNNYSVFCQYCNKVVVVQKKFQIENTNFHTKNIRKLSLLNKHLLINSQH